MNNDMEKKIEEEFDGNGFEAWFRLARIYKKYRHSLNNAYQAGFKAASTPLMKEIEELEKKNMELKKLITKYENTIQDVHEACLCERNLEGFDYHEVHQRLGKSTGRWLTPRDLIEQRIGFEWKYEKPEGVCNSWKQLNLTKFNLDAKDEA